MKKLMMCAAVAMAAVASQGATCVWNVSTPTSPNAKYIYAGNTTDKFSGKAYVFHVIGDVTQNWVFDQVFTEKKTLASIQNMLPADSGIPTVANPVTVTEGKISTTKLGTTGSGEGGAASGKSSFFLAIVDTSGNLFLSESLEQTESAQASGSALKFNVQTDSQKALNTSGTYSGAGWYGAVPEPTSGLLLLLGVAGLALRRRRA